MNLKSLFYMLWIVSLILAFPTSAVLAETEAAAETVIFAMTDPIGDERGPGTYTYPTHEHFAPYKGLFDITEFRVIDQDARTYRLYFNFVALPNPWRSIYGFSHPLIQVYIDNAKGGSTELFRRGAGVRLDPAAPWDVMLHITGWWVRLFRPADRQKLQDVATTWNLQDDPFDLVEARMLKKENTIEVTLPKKQVGQLENANLFVLIGSFDSFGYDYYRDIGKTSEDWAFGGSQRPDLTSRVLDLLVPEGMDQQSILTIPPDAAGPVTVPYISIVTKRPMYLGRNLLTWGLAAAAVLALGAIIVTKSKKNLLGA